MPFKNCKFYDLQSTQFPEGILHLQQEGGILITCDSIKNWLEADSFFSESTAKAYLEQQMFGPATISNIWRQATQVKNQELKDLQKLQFRHLLSAHGKPLLNDAYKHLLATLATL